jgi:hypothetical protein
MLAHSRDQVEGDQALGARAVLVLGAVHGKGDADAAENHLGLGAARLHHGVGLLAQPALVALVVLTDAGSRGIHFIKHRSAHWLDLQQGLRRALF